MSKPEDECSCHGYTAVLTMVCGPDIWESSCFIRCDCVCWVLADQITCHQVLEVLQYRITLWAVPVRALAWPNSCFSQISGARESCAVCLCHIMLAICVYQLSASTPFDRVWIVWAIYIDIAIVTITTAKDVSRCFSMWRFLLVEFDKVAWESFWL